MQTRCVDYDVVVMGAGLSGIDAGYRLQTECPNLTYTILEAREAMGGTWDLFRYPGIRSDSDLFTFGFEFKPWRNRKALADGPSILAYIKETAEEFGIDKHIQYGAKVVDADFDTRRGRWTLTLADGRTVTCRFWYSCAGYYDYDEGYLPDLPGLDDFAGTRVHPQFWPGDLDYAGKRIVVIGSGATAVTLVPELAKTAAHVTMLQRSPTWISPLPPTDPIADAARKYLPARAAHRLVRSKNIAFSTGFTSSASATLTVRRPCCPAWPRRPSAMSVWSTSTSRPATTCGISGSASRRTGTCSRPSRAAPRKLSRTPSTGSRPTGCG